MRIGQKEVRTMGKEKRAHVTVLRKPEKESPKWSRIYGYEGPPNCHEPTCPCDPGDEPCDCGDCIDCAPTWGAIKAQFA